MSKDVLIDSLNNLDSYIKLKEDIEKKVSPVSLNGLSGESISHVAYALKSHMKRQVLVLTYDDLRAKAISEDLSLFDKSRAELFPTRDVVFYDIDAFSLEIQNQRLRVMERLSRGDDIVVVASIKSIVNKVMSLSDMISNTERIEFGQIVDFEHLSVSLSENGYERVDMIEGKGQFAVRGGILDFFPVNTENPVRVELFDDEIDSIRIFDLATQRSIENITQIDIPPVKEILIGETEREKIALNIEKGLKSSIKKLEKAKVETDTLEKLEEKFESLINKVRNQLSVTNLDLIIPFIEDELSSLIDYLKEDSIVIVDEPNRVEESLKQSEMDFLEKYTNLFESGEVLSTHKDILYSLDEINSHIEKNIVLTSTNILKSNPVFKPKDIINFAVKGVQSFSNKIELLIESLEHYKYRGYKVIVLSGAEERGRSLAQNLKEQGLECTFVDKRDTEIKSGQVYVMAGSLHAGYEYSSLKFSIISDREVFGSHKKKKNRKARKDAKPIDSFRDLKVGDYIVHESHGIGKYLGTEQLKVQGAKKDYLSIKYTGEDKLYVPIDQMNLIQKYIGSDTKIPKVNKLGSADWLKTKTKVKRAIEDMAEDLIKLYATRETIKGFRFSQDTEWQKQFEDAFPYEETSDQLKSTEEIKRDMEQEEIMDRLLCGDVGYGKTEVALRAMFKAVMDSKQVAILVPTTILAQQHYNTLINRFSGFPVNIEMLSRFRTPKQQKKILEDVKVGHIDIVVGTHRLLSKDVKFRDLGLLVVDEEQRFGVKHKEAIKSFKETVDVLTLTATPIPRTLHMSLIGIRDMSVLEEPPEERYPIQTYVVEFNEQMIKDALIKEISRGGQAYILYNKVQSIDEFSAKIQRLVPEARVVVAHGQMGERELERVMVEFLEGEYDILVCTTIIETGLDIPNVNTIVIYDADKMGLSQLYQLRGRVGRSNRVAFSYFTYEKNKVLTEVAEKRLRAIKEFTEFGSGFKIAMRDLEIRGAGNLLGAEQHGEMADIGYDLYVKFLDEAIQKLKGVKREEVVDTLIELNVDGFIPKRYIEDEEQKIEVYKRISAIETKSDYSDILEELLDRFGDVPKQVMNLLKISYIKSLASRGKISSIKQFDDTIRIEFISREYMTIELIQEISKRFGNKLGLDASNTCRIKYKYVADNEQGLLDELEDVIGKISGFVTSCEDVKSN